jgi:RHS repeat-associated protein
MAGISDMALKTNYTENKYRFNGGNELQNKEFGDGSGLETYDANYRMYDCQIGRFWQIDPFGDLNEDFSPYSYANDDPIFLNDPMGLANDTTGAGADVPEMQPVVVTPPPPAPPKPVKVGIANTKGDDPDVAGAAGPAPTRTPPSPSPSPKPSSSPISDTKTLSDKHDVPISTIDKPKIDYYEEAQKYKGVPYTHDGVWKTGLDCSGLVCIATGHPGKDHIWNTHMVGTPPPGDWNKVPFSTSSREAFKTSIKVKDLLVWNSAHVGWYAGGGKMFAAHDFGIPLGFSGPGGLDYQLDHHGYPNAVYRQK